MRTMLMRFAGWALAVCVAGRVVAADGVWTNEAGGNWADPANWQDGVVAGGTEATASFPNMPTAYRTVALPPEGVTLGKLTYDRHGTDYQVRFRGGPMLFDAAAPEIAADYYFAIFYNDLMGSNGLTWRYGGVVGTDTSYTGPTSLAGGIVYDYMHLGALSEASSISNYLSTGPLLYKGGSLVVSGRSNTGATSSTWSLTAGDTLVRRVADYLTASPGAAVSGEGIPAGTFVKHSIDLDSFELSQPATASGAAALSFGPVSGSESHQEFERIEMQASGFIELATNGGSLTRVQADDLTGGLFLTLKLQGDGTLAVKGGDSFAGAMELSGGTFEHLAKAAGVQPVLSNLTVTAKTVFSVPDPATTSTLVNVTGAGELVKTGSGAVVMKSSPGPDSLMTVESGTLTVTTLAPPASPVEGAWFHVDAGDPASLTLVSENGTNYVTQWRDTRGNGRYAAAVEGAPRPFLREGFQNGLPVVDFGSFHFPGVGILGYGAYLTWSAPCTAIREVFLVFSDTPDTATISAGKNWSFLLGNPDRYDFHRNQFGELFNSPYGHPNLREGFIAVDGVRVPYSYRLPSGFHVISLSTTGPVAAALFANDRNASFGGQRLAEVLIYDHALEVSQRQDVGAYLMDKWLDRAYPGYRSATASGIGLLKLKGDGEFTVGEGEEVRVGSLELGGDIVKNGKGTLTAGVIHEAGGSLTVADGSVTLSQPAAADSAPAAGAWFHVDASDPASLTLVNENGTNYVTQWSDKQANGRFASAAPGAPRPFLREGFQNGLPVVDFGSYRYTDRIAGYGAFLNWNATGWGIRDIFLVFSDTPDCIDIPGGVNWSFLLGHDYLYNFHRNFNGVLFHPAVASPNLLNGAISVAGALGTYSTALTPGFHVVSLSPTGPVAASTFARDRDASTGGQRLAEVLVYDRTLSPTERRDTENYLLRKWLGVAAPGYEGGTVRMDGITFTGNANLAVDGAANGLALEWLTADGTLVKEGAGAMSVGSLRSGVTDLDVAGGQLTVACNLKQPWFHVDASDPASLTLVEENGQKYVTRWNDVRTNGVFASSPEGAPRPILRDGFQNGLPVVDFGSFRYVPQGYEGYGAYLNWNTECAAIREVFLVFSDTPDCVDIRDGCNWSFLLGHYNTYNFHRNFNGVLFHPAVASPNLLNGAITVDNATATYATALTPGFHVISLSPTGPVAASTFANDRNISFGGQRLAEVLIYTDVLSDTEKQGIREHLISKWKNTRTFGQIRAAAGSSVALTDSALVAGSLEGSGSVRAVRVTASEVSAGDAAGEIGTLSVSGALELAAGAVVPVDCDPPACDRIDVDGTLRLMGTGTFAVNCPASNFGNQALVLFTFSAVEGTEHLAGWTVTGDICSTYTVKPRIAGNQLLLTFTSKGTLLMLK